MADEAPRTVTVAVAGLPYRAKLVDSDGNEVKGADGKPRTYMRFAQRGDTVELIDEADVARGEKNGYFLKDGEQLFEPQQPVVSIDDIGLLTDEQLHELFQNDPPTAREVLEAVGDDPGLARRALQAEQQAGHEPRKTLVKGLEKVVGGGAE